jgi:short-subunit dehydrogenase
VRSEITVNYLGLVYCTHAMLPSLKQTRGRIVAVGSFESFLALPETAGYNASKHAMRGFLNTLRTELRATGVTVTMAHPGAVRTARLVEVMGENLKRIPSMSPERCAEIIIKAAAQRRREVVMTWPGKLLVALYPWIPGLLDRALARIADSYHT